MGRSVTKSVSTSVGKWYRTRVDVEPGEATTDTLHAVGGNVVLPSGAAGTFDVLQQAAGGSVAVGVETTSGQTIWDNLNVVRWDGRHAQAVAAHPPTRVAGSSGVMRGNAGMSFVSGAALIGSGLDVADYKATNRNGFAAHFVLRRSVASFVGYAPLFVIGETGGAGGRIQVEFNQSGLVRAQGRIGAASFEGRTAPNATLPNATDVVLTVSAHRAQGWRIYLNAVRVDNTNVGTPTGLAPKDLTDFDADNGCVYLGAYPASGDVSLSAGGATIYRFVYNDLDFYGDEHGLLKTALRLKAAYIG